MAREEELTGLSALEARRLRDIEYQNKRKERLAELGEHILTIRLDDENYKKLADLCENLGYQRPEARKYNLIETYSAVLKYLLRGVDDLREYKPKSNEAKEILRLHHYVSHLKYDKHFSNDDVISKLHSKGVKTPSSHLCNTVVQVRSGKLRPLNNKIIKYDDEDFINDLLNEELVIKEIIGIDKKTELNE